MPILSNKTPAHHPQHLQVDRDFAGRQILGTRDEQQDFYAFSIVEGDENGADKLLVIVADGVGGHIGGREASLAAVSGFVDAFFEALDAPDDAPETNAGGSPDVACENAEAVNNSPAPRCPVGARASLRTALTAANRAVDQMITSDPETLGEAGTTLVAALVERNSIQWISVGDSPLLLWSKGKLRRLNADHSMRAVFAEKVAAGQMRAGDIATHPERNALLAVLNGLEILNIDDPAEPVSLEPGDMVIAASDGLLTLSAAEISKELKKLNKAPVIDVVSSLLHKVEKKSNPKQDNTSIAIVRI